MYEQGYLGRENQIAEPVGTCGTVASVDSAFRHCETL
jgi:hypothetical protein